MVKVVRFLASYAVYIKVVRFLASYPIYIKVVRFIMYLVCKLLRVSKVLKVSKDVSRVLNI